MTEHEYNEQLSRVDKYEKYNNIIKGLERKAHAFSSGVYSIRSLDGITETKPSAEYDGERFPQLITKKIVEAYTEQINTIKKRMEEL